MPKKNVKSQPIDMTQATEARDRLCRLMDWPKANTNVLTAWRMVGTGKALAVGLEKCHQIANEIETLRARVKQLESAGN